MTETAVGLFEDRNVAEEVAQPLLTHEFLRTEYTLFRCTRRRR
jgi:hypothetical protein